MLPASSAHIGNSAAAQGATVFSGDFLSTDDGGSLLVRIGMLSVELQSSSMHIYRAPYGAVLELNRGSVNYSIPSGGQNVVIVASDVRVTPVLAQADFGRVGHESHFVEEGKAYSVRAENPVSYSKYLSPDDDDYHKHHEHQPCAAAYQTA